jgi:hypothetical protein
VVKQSLGRLIFPENSCCQGRDTAGSSLLAAGRILLITQRRHQRAFLLKLGCDR